MTESTGGISDGGNPFVTQEVSPPYNAEWEAKRRLSSAITRLTEALLTSVAPVAGMSALVDRLEAAAQELESSPRLYGRERWVASGEHGNIGEVGHELNALGGWSNPVAPPVKAWIEGDLALGSARCGWAYEGPPGSVHGGFVAAIFDQFLGVAQVLGKQPGMTAYLHVNYHARTPLHSELRLEGRLVKCEGRKTIMRGDMYAGDTLTASCEGLFVQPRDSMAALTTQQPVQD